MTEQEIVDAAFADFERWLEGKEYDSILDAIKDYAAEALSERVDGNQRAVLKRMLGGEP